MRKTLYMFFLCFALAESFLPAYASTDIGQPAPELKVTQFDGATFNLSSLKGSVVIIHFWATWCPACREEMPILDELYQKHHATNLKVLALSMDRHHDRDEAILIMQPFHFPAAMKSDAETNEFDEIHTLPTTYVIDKQGIIRAILKPDKQSFTDRTLESIIDPLLSK